MCYHPQRVAPSSPSGTHFQYVPCGHCEQCRNTARYGWSFRLQAEMQARRDAGWHVGFCTLTYDDEHLPYMWPEMFSVAPGEPVPCFSREHVRGFIHAVRKYVHRHYRVKELSYMVCSEFGEHRHRPHYHLLISWPDAKCVDKSDLGNHEYLDSETMYRIIGDCWPYGFKIPKYHSGGFDGLKNHNPFEVSSPVAFAAKYAAKYCCKDMGYFSFLSKFQLNEEADYLKEYIRDCMPFHMQSRSLGWRMVRDMSDDEKFKLLQLGYFFAGNDSYQQVPLYIRNKIFFDPSYIIDSSGKRVVRRDASQWFNKYRREIYDQKVSFYSDLVVRCTRSDFWLSHGLDGDKAMQYASFCIDRVSDQSFSPLQLAREYVSYYGVDRDKCFKVDLCDQWFSRYSDYWFYVDEYGELHHDDGQSVGNSIDFSGCELLDSVDYDRITQFWTFIFRLLEATNNFVKYDAELKALSDYWKCASADAQYRLYTSTG